MLCQLLCYYCESYIAFEVIVHYNLYHALVVLLRTAGTRVVQALVIRHDFFIEIGTAMQRHGCFSKSARW